jgi:RNA polymerase-associated protein
VILFDAARCPYCARARIVLAEKGIPYETVEIDLSDRPAWLYEKNPRGKVPVIEEDEFIMPESSVIMEYLDERFPEPALLPDDPADRAAARLWIWDFDRRLGDDYYAARRGEDGARERLTARLAALDMWLEGRQFLAGGVYGLADIAYMPWILRMQQLLGVDLAPFEALAQWRDELVTRPAVAAELGLVAAL